MLTRPKSDFILYDQPLVSPLSWKSPTRWRVRVRACCRAYQELPAALESHERAARVFEREERDVKVKSDIPRWMRGAKGRRERDRKREREREGGDGEKQDTRIPGRRMIESDRACELRSVSCSRSQHKLRNNPLALRKHKRTDRFCKRERPNSDRPFRQTAGL